MTGTDNALVELGYADCSCELMREKDGVTVARVHIADKTAVLKHFGLDVSDRETDNYRLLARLGVPTPAVIAICRNALLIEDMSSADSRYRLAAEGDMADENSARLLATWYRKLHDAGYDYVKRHGSNMYSENALFTPENIETVKLKCGAGIPRVWQLLEDNYDTICRRIGEVPMTLTYNDFYYTNMAVARDGGSAIMFDYNLLGKGYAFSDMRNVMYSLSTEAGHAFRESYGMRDFRLEESVDAIVSPIITLHFACAREKFPAWGLEAVEHLKGAYVNELETFLSGA